MVEKGKEAGRYSICYVADPCGRDDLCKRLVVAIATPGYTWGKAELGESTLEGAPILSVVEVDLSAGDVKKIFTESALANRKYRLKKTLDGIASTPKKIRMETYSSTRHVVKCRLRWTL